MLRILIACLAIFHGSAYAQLASQVRDEDWRLFVEIRSDGSARAQQLIELFRNSRTGALPEARSFLVSVLPGGQDAVVALRPPRGCARALRDGDAVSPLPRPDLETCFAMVVAIGPDGAMRPRGALDLCSRVSGNGEAVLDGPNVAMAAATARFVNVGVRTAGQPQTVCFSSYQVR